MPVQSINPRDVEIDLTHLARPKLHQPAVERYMESFDALPPILVYRVDGRQLLADGHHRLEAAFRLGKTAIDADVRDGTMDDLAAAAFSANASSGEPLTSDERDRCVVGLAELDWSARRIGQAFGLSKSRINDIVAANRVSSTVSTSGQLPSRTLAEISRAHPDDWQQLADTTKARGWDHKEVQAAASNLRDPRIGDGYRERLKSGEVEPVVFDKTGQAGLLSQTISRNIRSARSGSWVAWLGFAEKAALLYRVPADDLIADVPPEDRADFEREVARLRAYLESISYGLGSLRAVQ